MKKENTSIRLKRIMSERNLRQVDILEMVKPYCTKYEVKMNKSDLSQYVSGKVEPGQDKLVILGMALNINETWLMGFDVQKERCDSNSNSLKILEYYNQLNDIGKHEATKRVKELTYLPQYLPSNNAKAAHNDYLSESGEYEKMQEDLSNLKRPD